MATNGIHYRSHLESSCVCRVTAECRKLKITVLRCFSGGITYIHISERKIQVRKYDTSHGDKYARYQSKNVVVSAAFLLTQ
jgi:hypothetical protein